MMSSRGNTPLLRRVSRGCDGSVIRLVCPLLSADLLGQPRNSDFRQREVYSALFTQHGLFQKIQNCGPVESGCVSITFRIGLEFSCEINAAGPTPGKMMLVTKKNRGI